jgi:GNAT superfamily N-acetyltransferase
VNHAYNVHHGTTVGGFGFLDAEPDTALVQSLLEAAEEWLAAQGVTEVWGPLEFCLYDRVGLQVDGFDRPLPMSAAYHTPGLCGILEGAGYHKKRDALTFVVPTPHHVPEYVCQVVERRPIDGLTVRRYEPARKENEARAVARIIDRAFHGNWLHFPFPEALLRYHAQEMAPLLQPAHVQFAEVHGEPVGLVVVIPDLGPLLRATGGRLIPWGLPGLWRQLRAPRELLVVVLAVVPEYHSHGVVAHLMNAMMRTGIQRRCRRLCTTFVDEDNRPMVNVFRRLHGRVYARHRVYAKMLTAAAEIPGRYAGIVNRSRSRG